MALNSLQRLENPLTKHKKQAMYTVEARVNSFASVMTGELLILRQKVWFISVHCYSNRPVCSLAFYFWSCPIWSIFLSIYLPPFRRADPEQNTILLPSSVCHLELGVDKFSCPPESWEQAQVSGIQPTREILGVQFAFRILEPYKEKLDKFDCVRRAVLLLRNTVLFKLGRALEIVFVSC